MVINRGRICKIFAMLLAVFILAVTYLSYVHYLTLKKKLISVLSSRATIIAGQQIGVRDLSLSLSGRVTLSGLSIENPEGCGPGKLLQIETLGLDMRLRELFRGRVHFNDIAIDSPALTLVQDNNGKMNVSDRLMKFFSQKSDLRYAVDRIRISSGTVDVNGDARFRNEDIRLVLTNLSSEQTTETRIEGSTSYAGNVIKVLGRAYLNDAGKKFAVSLSSSEFSLRTFSGILKRYNIDPSKLGIQADCDLSGDLKSGVRIVSDIRIKNPGLSFVSNGGDTIRMSMDVFYNIRAGSIVINKSRLQMDTDASAEMKGVLADIVKTPSYDAEIRIERLDLARFHFMPDMVLKGTLVSDSLQVKGRFGMHMPSLSGSLFLENGSMNTAMAGIGKISASLTAAVHLQGRDLSFTAKAATGSVAAAITGGAKNFLHRGRSVKVKAVLPQVQISEVRNSLWDIFPDSLLYTGLGGSLSSDISIFYDASGLKVEGDLALKDVVLSGENEEYSIGPVSGVIPLSYAKSDGAKDTVKIPSFERTDFEHLKKYYAENEKQDTKETIAIGSLKYGFRLLEDIRIRMEKQGGILNIPRFSATISGGKIHGSAFLDIGGGFRYRAGIIVEGVSLARLCSEIEPIKGYLSGRIDGIMDIRGAGPGFSGITGKADFWSYSTADEKTRISREFLHKIGGPSLKTYIGDRAFSRGNMSFLLKDGFIIFRELEISNRNIFGIRDLSIQVAPLNNRISIDHLMWTITEAAQRAKKE